MRIFGSDRISGLMQRLGMEEGVPIEAGMVTKAIERAQKQVEAQNFSVRKHLLEYDDVMNKQRESIYALRRELLDGQIRYTEEDEKPLDTRDYLLALGEDLAANTVASYADKDADPESWDLEALETAVSEIFGFDADDREQIDFASKTSDEMTDLVWDLAKAKYEKKESMLEEPAVLHRVERDIMLQIVDAQWKDHLYSLDHLKEGIGLRGYGQRDPLVEYKKESFTLFQAMKDRIDEEMVRYLWRVRPVIQEEGAPAPPPIPQPVRRQAPMTLSGGSSSSSTTGPMRATVPNQGGGPPMPSRVGGDDAPIKPVRRDEPKIGRNDPCYCGSGKKYKKCHGA
jgi:preprotein translocase subunit SecA